mmetsp:Transcript_29834/g.93199  ORF Transcript_29834/g.93199 Transcript_29834/m.93199 type:complete len:263 (-) Transcript_29834:7-795(-)
MESRVGARLRRPHCHSHPGAHRAHEDRVHHASEGGGKGTARNEGQQRGTQQESGFCRPGRQAGMCCEHRRGHDQPIGQEPAALVGPAGTRVLAACRGGRASRRCRGCRALVLCGDCRERGGQDRHQRQLDGRPQHQEQANAHELPWAEVGLHERQPHEGRDEEDGRPLQQEAVAWLERTEGAVGECSAAQPLRRQECGKEQPHAQQRGRQHPQTRGLQCVLCCDEGSDRSDAMNPLEAALPGRCAIEAHGGRKTGTWLFQEP